MKEGINMPIMELLQQQKPRRRTSERIDRQYKAFVGYISEIEEAQRYGYTWNQIGSAVRVEMGAKGEWDESWDIFDVQKIFYMEKRRCVA